MRSQWIVVGVVMMFAFLSAFEAAAQGPGPQGVGAEKAAQSSHAPRSYDPIKWMKKDSKTETAKSKKVKNNKPAEKSATPDAPLPPWKLDHPEKLGIKS
jgi:hypothetical protein